MANVPNQKVLVLNKYFAGIAVCGLVRAISFVVESKAEIIGITPDGFYPFNFEDWLEVSKNPALAGLSVEQETMITTGRDKEGNVKKFYSPRVVRLTSTSYFPDGKKQLRPTRSNILSRDDFTCQYCGKSPSKKDLNLDHVMPSSRGGGSDWENLVTSCRRCNTFKANRTPSEAGMKLIRQPFRPKPVEGLVSQLDGDYMEQYNKILGIK